MGGLGLVLRSWIGFLGFGLEACGVGLLGSLHNHNKITLGKNFAWQNSLPHPIPDLQVICISYSTGWVQIFPHSPCHHHYDGRLRCPRHQNLVSR